MKDKMTISIETMHLADKGETENASSIKKFLFLQIYIFSLFFVNARICFLLFYMLVSLGEILCSWLALPLMKQSV